jgi:hypothetical protein
VYIEPGAPRQNPYVESFNGKVRDELLDIEEFSWLAEARVVIEDWPRGLQPPQATQLARDAIPRRVRRHRRPARSRSRGMNQLQLSNRARTDRCPERSR